MLVLSNTAVAQKPIGDLISPDASVKGSVQTVSTGTRVMSGSSVSAGSTTAGIRLVRGGELRVCPRTTVSLTTSTSGRDLAIGIDTGGIETDYRVVASAADTIMTPDFRILLAGPGEFSYAIRADARGNTCIRSLSQSGGAIIISEIMGDGTYQLQPGEQVYLRNGSVANPNRNVPPDCGCPAPVPMVNANTQPMPQPVTPVPAPPAVQPQPVPPPTTPSAPEKEPAAVPTSSPEAVFAEHGHAATNPVPTVSGATPEPATAPKPDDSEVHVQVDAPFVYRGDAPAELPPPPQIAQLRLVYLPKLIADTQNTTVLPPDARAKAKKHKGSEQVKPTSKGFFGHIKSFFGSIFK